MKKNNNQQIAIALITLLVLGALVCVVVMYKGESAGASKKRTTESKLMKSLKKADDLAAFKKIFEREKNNISVDDSLNLLVYHYHKKTNAGKAIADYLITNKNLNLNQKIASGESKGYTIFAALALKDTATAFAFKQDYEDVDINAAVKDDLTFIQYLLLHQPNATLINELMKQYDEEIWANLQTEVQENEDYQGLKTWTLCLYNQEKGTSGLFKTLKEADDNKAQEHKIDWTTTAAEGPHKSMNILRIAIKEDQETIVNRFIDEKDDKGHQVWESLFNSPDVLKEVSDYSEKKGWKESKDAYHAAWVKCSDQIRQAVQQALNSKTPTQQLKKAMAGNKIQAHSPWLDDQGNETNLIRVLIANQKIAMLEQVVDPSYAPQRNHIIEQEGDHKGLSLLMLCCKERLFTLALKLLDHKDLNLDHRHKDKDVVNLINELTVDPNDQATQQNVMQVYQKIIEHPRGIYKRSFKELQESAKVDGANHPHDAAVLASITTELISAAANGNTEAIKKLQKLYEIDLTATTIIQQDAGGGLTMPLWFALIVSTDKTEVYDDMTAIADEKGTFSLTDEVTITKGSKNDPLQENYKTTALGYSVENNDKDAVTYFAGKTQEINAVFKHEDKGETILTIAIKSQNCQDQLIFHTLLDHPNLDFMQKGQSFADLLKLVKQHKPQWEQVIKKKKQALLEEIVACVFDKQDTQKADQLLNKHPELKQKLNNHTRKGMPMAYAACEALNKKALEWLCETLGPDLDVHQQYAGNTPAKLLCSQRYLTVSTKMFDCLVKADPNFWDKERGLFQVAIANKYYIMADHLLTHVEQVDWVRDHLNINPENALQTLYETIAKAEPLASKKLMERLDSITDAAEVDRINFWKVYETALKAGNELMLCEKLDFVDEDSMGYLNWIWGCFKTNENEEKTLAWLRTNRELIEQQGMHNLIKKIEIEEDRRQDKLYQFQNACRGFFAKNPPSLKIIWKKVDNVIKFLTQSRDNGL